MFAASAFRKLSSIYVFSYFPFGFEGRIWDLIVSVPDHCLSFYFLVMQQLWNSFPDEFRKVSNFNQFKALILNWNGGDFKCNLCR